MSRMTTAFITIALSITFISNCLNNGVVHAQELPLNPKFTVCTSQRPPMSECVVDLPGPYQIDSSYFKGFSISILRELKDSISTDSTSNGYELVCLADDITTIMSKLANNTDFIINGQNYTCDAYIAAATITAERKMNGVKFAHPYYQGSLGIMVKYQKDVGVAGWNWVQPFSWQLWVAIIITILLWPPLLFAVELMSVSKSWGKAGNAVRGVEEATWQALWCLKFGDTIDVVSIGARVTAVTFGLLALVITSTYTANLAAFLTLQSKFSGIQGVDDLRGMSVASTEGYIPKLETAFGWSVVPKNISSSSTSDLEPIVLEVNSGNLKAFLYDYPMLKGAVARYADVSKIGQCRVRLLTETVLRFDFGLAFPQKTPMDDVDAFSVAIIQLQGKPGDGTSQGSLITKLFDESMSVPKSKCLDQIDSLSDDIDAKITFRSVYGLWVIAGCGFLLGLIIAVGVRVYRNTYGWPNNRDGAHGVLGNRKRHLEPMVSAVDEDDDGDDGDGASLGKKLDGGV